MPTENIAVRNDYTQLQPHSLPYPRFPGMKISYLVIMFSFNFPLYERLVLESQAVTQKIAMFE